MIDGHLGQHIDVVADQHISELGIKAQAVANEPPAQKAPVHRVAKHQATMLLELLRRTWPAGLSQIVR
ncbi:hypothetical protein D9M71_578430 [compost metagenome]